VAGADRETTIIDGDSNGTVVTFENGEDSTAVLKGFTLTNGSNYSGGGLFLQGSNTRPKLIDLIIENNFTSGLEEESIYGMLPPLFQMSSLEIILQIRVVEFLVDI
jgi:hypothetical protein